MSFDVLVISKDIFLEYAHRIGTNIYMALEIIEAKSSV